MQSITVAEVAQYLPDLIDAVMRGEEIIITKDNCSVAKIVPATSNKPRPRFGSAKGLITMSDDFDEPLEDFKEYM
ncbi:MAG: type II toxin-antitoxin system Phd/YefM family antitoxin [Cyanobacteria bacterium P01_C01_bin.72]